MIVLVCKECSRVLLKPNTQSAKVNAGDVWLLTCWAAGDGTQGYCLTPQTYPDISAPREPCHISLALRPPMN
ncbi:hypothetical protein J6590_037323 [Homalodisca vitripennis]|nr:hypothetical protein J6590_037323 [Homalodisca vitripennis]